jgi:hypothetical protein
VGVKQLANRDHGDPTTSRFHSRCRRRAACRTRGARAAPGMAAGVTGAVSTPRPTVARPNSNGYFGRWNSARRRGVGKALGRRWLQVRGGPVGHRVRCVGEDEEGVASAASGGCVLSGVCAQARCVSPRGNRACSTRARRARRRAVHTRSRGGAFRQLSESNFVS